MTLNEKVELAKLAVIDTDAEVFDAALRLASEGVATTYVNKWLAHKVAGMPDAPIIKITKAKSPDAGFVFKVTAVIAAT